MIPSPLVSLFKVYILVRLVTAITVTTTGTSMAGDRAMLLGLGYQV